MLSTEQRKTRLEDLLVRVRKNKSRTAASGGSAVAAATQTSPAALDIPAPAAMPKPAPVAAPAPVIEPQATAAAPVAAPVAPKAPIHHSAPPAPIVEMPTAESFPTEHDDDEIDFGFADSLQSAAPAAPAPVEIAAPAAAPVVAQPIPEVAPATPKTFPSAPAASAPVVSVQGERPDDWTIGAVLERAWTFGAQ